jgi:hypothetical protein
VPFVTVTPTDVSFNNVELREYPGPASEITGYFDVPGGRQLNAHTPAGWTGLGKNGAPVSSVVDNCAMWKYPSPWSAGSYTWVIPWRWRVTISPTNHVPLTGNLLRNVNQVMSILGVDGKSRVTKLGQTTERTPAP